MRDQTCVHNCDSCPGGDVMINGRNSGPLGTYLAKPSGNSKMAACSACFSASRAVLARARQPLRYPALVKRGALRCAQRERASKLVSKLAGLDVCLVVRLLHFGCKGRLHCPWGPELPARRTGDGNWKLNVMHRSSVGWMDTTLKCPSTKSK